MKFDYHINYFNNNKINLQEWFNYGINIIKPKSKSQHRLIIFGQGRTGSTLLESLLSSTEYFNSYGELLNTSCKQIRYPLKYILGISKRGCDLGFIFHLKIYQLTYERNQPINPCTFLTKLQEHGWHVIYLRRNNKIYHVLSSLIAEHTGSYHRLNNTISEIKISVDCKDFIERVKWRKHFEVEEKTALANVKYLEVVYENDLEHSKDHQETINSILEYISVKPRKAESNYKKVNTYSLKELIINYSEFYDCIKENGWEKFIK